jgi:L-rhamnose isomerase/sugar isomerase
MNYADPRDATYIASANQPHASALASDYAALGAQLERRGIRIDDITRAVANFKVAIPSWGVGTGGTRFARFAEPGEPRDVYEKLEDCATILKLVRSTRSVSTFLIN